MIRQNALKILEELKNSPNMVKHALACGFVMRSLCQKLSSEPSTSSGPSEPFDPNDWEIVGILHDADYEITGKSLEHHTDETTKKLKELTVDQLIIDAIRGHCDKAPRSTLMAKSVYAADELTGLIVACALVQPDKKLSSVSVESVMRKFKDASFARGANRDQIKTCETELEIPLGEFASITLKAMQERAIDIGL
jgi:uncharacterized protein